MKSYNILLIFLIAFLFQDCNSPSDISKEESHTDILDTVLEKNEEEVILVDSFQTSIANLISCKDGRYFDTIGDVNFSIWWKSLSDEIDVDYTGLYHSTPDISDVYPGSTSARTSKLVLHSALCGN